MTNSERAAEDLGTEPTPCEALAHSLGYNRGWADAVGDITKYLQSEAERYGNQYHGDFAASGMALRIKQDILAIFTPHLEKRT